MEERGNRRGRHACIAVLAGLLALSSACEPDDGESPQDAGGGALTDGGSAGGFDAGAPADDAGSPDGGPGAPEDGGEEQDSGIAPGDAGRTGEADAGGLHDGGASTVDAGGDHEVDAGPSEPGVVPPPVCGCPAGTRLLRDLHSKRACVSALDPAYGCAQFDGYGSATCGLPHASAQCIDGSCAVFQCDLGWGDCPGDGNGCATDLTTSEAHCGACGHACEVGETCQDGVCAASGVCEPPLTDCGGGVCANLLSSPHNCGGCGDVCSAQPGMQASCNGGCSQVEAPCPPGLVKCGGKCVSLPTDVYNCGECGNVCPVSDGRAACVNGSCEACAPGLTACPRNGYPLTCQDTTRSTSDCGGCGIPCDGLCVDSQCQPLASFAVYTGSLSTFVMDEDFIFVLSPQGDLAKVAKSGGAVTPLATALPTQHIAESQGYIYWTNRLGAAVMRLSKDGGSSTLVSAASEPGDLVVDDTYVYWINGADKTIRKRDKSGAGEVVTLYTGQAANLQQNSTHLGFRLQNIPRILPKAGGGAVDLVSGQVVLAYALSDDYCYAVPYDKYTGNELTYSTGSNCTGPGGNLGGGGYEEGGWGDVWALRPVGAQNVVMGAEAIVPDGAYVYYQSVDGIRKAAHCDNRSPSLVADVQSSLIRVDATHLYWTDGSAIYRIHK